MDKRMEELSKLRTYTEEIDKDLTMILQSLQWDRKHILQHPMYVTCKYDTNHRVLLGKVEEHEQECILRHNGYTKEDILLPDPLDADSSTLVKLSKADIAHIIDNASKTDQTFKKGVGSGELEPQTLGRLQCAYSSDERRAIHDAVVSAAPACHDLTDLALPSIGEDDKVTKTKSRTEILAELRDMRRRRTKYRVAVKSTNYSDVLRDVIKTQMELYHGAVGDIKPNIDELNVTRNKQTYTEQIDNTHSKGNDRDKYERMREYSRDDGRDKERRHDERDKERGHRREISHRHRKEGAYSEERDRRDENSRDERRGSRHRREYTHRERPVEVKQEVLDEDYSHESRIKEASHRHRSEEREHYKKRHSSHKHDERPFGIKLEKTDSDLRYERSKAKYNEGYSGDNNDRKRRRDRHRERSDERDRDLTDGERARNLIVEIKREIDFAERINDVEDYRDDCTYTSSIETRDEKRYKDYKSRGSSYQRKERGEGHGHRQEARHRTDSDKCEKSAEGDEKDRKRRHKKHKREKHEKRKESKDSQSESHRDRSTDDKCKILRATDKHKIYHEVYSQLNTGRSSDNENK